MAIRLKDVLFDDGSIPVNQLEDDQVAVIVRYDRCPDWVGGIVKRSGYYLVGITINLVCRGISNLDCEYVLVKPLPNGDLSLIVSDNE